MFSLTSSTLEVFGPYRCMVASDWPVVTLMGSAGRWVDVVLEAIAQLPAPQRAAVLSGTATAVYGLADPAPGRSTGAGSAVSR
jgi:L-fuconolactonase